MSTVPTACTQTESCVIGCNIDKAWAKFGDFAFNAMAPNVVSSVAWNSGKAGEIGSVAKVTYKDGSNWTVRFSEFSEKHHRVCYELISAEPSTTCTSVQGDIQLLRISQDDTTFCSWTTEFSNDADLVIISDQKYKKLETFGNIQETLGTKPVAAATGGATAATSAPVEEKKDAGGAAGGASGTMPQATTSVKVHNPPGGRSQGLW